MSKEIQALSDKYIRWLKEKTVLRQVGDWTEITTPYLDRHNDCLQIYAKQENGRYLLSDDGYTVEDLEESGCKLESPKRRTLLEMTLRGFGIQLDGDRLTVHASADNFALRKHNLVQAMLAVNDLFYLAEPIVVSLFLEDVLAWLDLLEVRYAANVKFTGKSGYDHMFHFVVPHSKKAPERLLRALNRPSRENAESFAFAWYDTREVRPPESRAYAILNDSEHEVPGAVVDALRNYEVRPVFWTKRDAFREELAA